MRKRGTVPRLLFLTAAFPPVAGGAETYAGQISDALAQRGWNVVVVTDGSRTATPDSSDSAVRRLRDYKTLLDSSDLLAWEQMSFSLLGEIGALAAQHRPDVIFSNGLETAITGRIVADHLMVPLAANFHEHAPEDDPCGVGKMRAVYGRLAPEAVIAGSQMYADRALRFARPETVHLVPHGIDTLPFETGSSLRAMTRRNWGVSDRERVIMCPGRFKHRKGQSDALEAFAVMASEADVLVFVGSTSSGSERYRDDLIGASSKVTKGRVTFDESRGPAQMPAAYAAADLVVLPSLSEGLGFTLIESLASGARTVATDIAGFREVLGDSAPAHIAAPADPDDLRLRMTEALEENERESTRRAIEGRTLVSARFSIDAMGDDTDLILRRILTDHANEIGHHG